MIELGRPRWFYLLFLVGIASILLRVLLGSPLGNSALVYVAVPFLISLILFHFLPRSEGEGLGVRLSNHFRDATIILLLTSAFLFEGFICVLMFMPIYYFLMSIYFGIALWREKNEGGASKFAMIVPAVVVTLSLEGVLPQTSFDRENSVVKTLAVPTTISKLQSNMAAPIEFEGKRHWFLQVFPLPVSVEAGSLAEGDIHKLHFIYKRWFFTNTHEGEFHLRIDEVTPERVRTSVVHNSSYLATYLKIDGTQVDFKELPNGQTKVSLTVHYERLLDPVWYFGPLQRFAVEQSADYLIRSVITREASDG